MVIKRTRTIVLPNFYGEGKHVYDDQLDWQPYMKEEARSYTSKGNFDFHVVRVGLNLAFYYLDDDTFYGIHTEEYPIEVKILPRDRSKKYIGCQCDANTHDDGEVIASFDDEHDIWDNLKIGGKSLEEVLHRSFIMTLT